MNYETWTFYCGKIQANTGETEPDWISASTVGTTIIDNNLVWQNSNKYADNIYATWEKDGKYELYSDINVGYEIPAYCTSNTEPTWGKITIPDGNVSMTLVKSYNLLSGWEANKDYTAGEHIIIGLWNCVHQQCG